MKKFIKWTLLHWRVEKLRISGIKYWNHFRNFFKLPYFISKCKYLVPVSSRGHSIQDIFLNSCQIVSEMAAQSHSVTFFLAVIINKLLRAVTFSIVDCKQLEIESATNDNSDWWSNNNGIIERKAFLTLGKLIPYIIFTIFCSCTHTHWHTLIRT